MQLKKGDCDLNELINFVFSIYGHTNGKYLLLEWVKKKPSTNVFSSFEVRRINEKKLLLAYCCIEESYHGNIHFHLLLKKYISPF